MYTPEQYEHEQAMDRLNNPKPKCRKTGCSNDCEPFNNMLCRSHTVEPKEIEFVEVEEEFRNGVLVQRKFNGIPQPLPIGVRDSVIFIKQIPREEVAKMYGSYYKLK